MAQVSRDVETVRVLLDKGMDVNGASEEGFTPLSGAISNGQTACMEMLLQRGARTDTVDRYGASLLIRAIQASVKEEWRLAVIDRLLAQGVDPNLGIDNPNDSEFPVPSVLKAAMCGRRDMWGIDDPFHTAVAATPKAPQVSLAMAPGSRSKKTAMRKRCCWPRALGISRPSRACSPGASRRTLRMRKDGRRC